MGLGLDEGSIGMDTLSVSFEIVKSRKSSTTVVVRANMGFGSERVMRLNVRLRVSASIWERKKTYLEVEGPSTASTTNTTPVSLLGIVRSLTGDVSTTTTVEVGERNVGRELGLDIVFRHDRSSVKFILAFTRCDSGHGDGGGSSD